jgi:MoaA/NifB/PqqE/SkfB family radical SAM enzyme
MDYNFNRVEVSPGTYYNRSRDCFTTSRLHPKIISRPLSVAFRLGRYCNLRCSICLSDSGTDRIYNPLSLSSLIEQLSEFGPLRIVWTGGEPMLYPIEKDLRISIEKGNFNIINTNLTKIDKMKDFGKEIVYDVSIYGFDRTSYLKTTGKDYFNQVEQNLIHLCENRKKVVASIRVDQLGISE